MKEDEGRNKGMQVSSKLLVRTAIVLLSLLMTMVFFMAINSSQEASALTSDQWTVVRNAVKGYIASQAQYADDGEAGFTINRATLKGRIDSNGNMSPTGSTAPTNVTGVLGEGDDAANAPVIVDNLFSQGNVIPGTSVRCNWNASYGTANCFDADKVAEIAGRVNAHEAAGFSTDLVVYCLTGRTESVTVGGLGPLAQTGALGGSSTPKVLAFKWGRNGWTGSNTTTSAATGATGAGIAPGSWVGFDSNPTKCDSYSSNADVVRCAAQWAIYVGAGDPAWGGNGYNHSNGQTAAPTATQQVIDIRTPSPAATIQVAGAPTTKKIPVEHLFDSQLGYMSMGTSGAKNVIVGRTMHLPLIVSTGAVMLGYDSTGYVWGVNSWNTSLGGESYQTGGLDTPNYPTQTATANNETSAIDLTAPVVSSVSAGSITDTSAVINRVAGEPATMKVEYGTAPGVYGTPVNDTVLNANKNVPLSGLSASTTYYYRVTSYDGQANGTVSAEGSFTTAAPPCSTTAPSLSLAAPIPLWASYADYEARKLSVSWTVNNTGAVGATNVQMTGSTPNGAVTLITAMPVVIGNIAAGGSGSTVLQYNVPVGYGGFHVWNTASAQDECGTITVTYP